MSSPLKKCKTRGNRASKHNGRVGRGSSIQGATTRYLTRIITYLSEVKTKAYKTTIMEACFGGKPKTANDAIQWLDSNGIIIRDHQSNGGIMYYLNPEFEKLRSKNVN